MTSYIDLDELAALLGMDRNAAYLLTRSGEFHAIRTGAGRWYVDREQALRYKDSQ